METVSELAEMVLQLLKKKNMHVTFVESCTGGMLASSLVSISGASAVMEQAMVTYSNEAKKRLAGVKESTLEQYGAVSSQTAMEMAEGGAKRAECEVCVSVTGVAGPGMEEDKPVGLVFLGIFFLGNVRAVECHFLGNRQEIREAAVKKAFELIMEELKEMEEKK